MKVVTYLTIRPTKWSNYTKKPTKAQVVKATQTRPLDTEGIVVRLELEVPEALLEPYQASITLALPEPKGEPTVVAVEVQDEEVDLEEVQRREALKEAVG